VGWAIRHEDWNRGDRSDDGVGWGFGGWIGVLFDSDLLEATQSWSFTLHAGVGRWLGGGPAREIGNLPNPRGHPRGYADRALRYLRGDGGVARCFSFASFHLPRLDGVGDPIGDDEKGDGGEDEVGDEGQRSEGGAEEENREENESDRDAGEEEGKEDELD
jgi:hypothetical protein